MIDHADQKKRLNVHLDVGFRPILTHLYLPKSTVFLGKWLGARGWSWSDLVRCLQAASCWGSNDVRRHWHYGSGWCSLIWWFAPFNMFWGGGGVSRMSHSLTSVVWCNVFQSYFRTLIIRRVKGQLFLCPCRKILQLWGKKILLWEMKTILMTRSV